jgi:hypothetical protein
MRDADDMFWVEPARVFDMLMNLVSEDKDSSKSGDSSRMVVIWDLDVGFGL